MKTLADIDPVELGAELKESRQLSCLTQEQVASHLGISRTTVVAIEKGDRKIRSEEFATLCKLYNISASQLLREDKIKVNFAVKFRKDAKYKIDEETTRYAVDLLTDLSTAYVEIENIIGNKKQYAWLPEQTIYSGDVVRQAEDAALSLRHRLGLGLSPVNDVVSLFETELGFRIFARPIASNISALFAFDEEIGPCVLLNSKHPAKRRSFSTAHEGGHYISSRRSPDIYIEGNAEQTREEKYANSFALEFLMPAISIRQRFQDIQNRDNKFSPRSLIIMAYTFHVTPEAMCRRLESLELLKTGTFDSLKERGFNGEAVSQVIGNDNEDSPLALPPRLSFLVSEAFHYGYLSEGQLCEMFHLEQIEFRTLIEAFNNWGQDGNTGPS